MYVVVSPAAVNECRTNTYECLVKTLSYIRVHTHTHLVMMHESEITSSKKRINIGSLEKRKRLLHASEYTVAAAAITTYKRTFTYSYICSSALQIEGTNGTVFPSFLHSKVHIVSQLSIAL